MARKAIYLFCLAFCLVLATAASSHAASGTQFSVAGGWGFYQMDELNTRYIDNFAKPFGMLNDNITNGLNFQADLDYFLTDQLAVGIGVEFLSGATDGKVQMPVTDATGAVTGVTTVKNELRTAATAPHVRVQYIHSAGPVNLTGGAGLAYLFGRAKLTENAGSPANDRNHKYSAEGFGLLTNLGVLWPVGGRVSVSLMSGYRLYHTDTLQEGNDPWVVEYSGLHGTMDLDFSGPYLLVGLAIRL